MNYQLMSFAKDTQAPATDKEDTLTGYWYNFNAHGCSTMYITSISKKGKIVGDFANGQADWCAKPEEWFPLTGDMVGNDALEFNVNWQNNNQDCHSITTWDASIKDHVISTNWVMISTDEGKTFRGEDSFSRECKCNHCPTP